jgi:outer membrane protein assembly factor BamE
MHSRPLFLTALLALLACSGCVYRMNIQQGNYLEPRTVDQLQVGMTRSQVRYLLGTPMVPDAFDADRWDYLYYLKQGRIRSPQQQLLTVYFQEDKVARIERPGPLEKPQPLEEPAPIQEPAPAAAPVAEVDSPS